MSLKVLKIFIISALLLWVFLSGFFIALVTSSENIVFDLTRKETSEIEFISFIDNDMKTEKMHLIIEIEDSYYNIDYYVYPLSYIPVKRFKVSKEVFNFPYANHFNKKDIEITYSCLSLLEFDKYQPKKKDIHKYYDYPIINYKGIKLEEDSLLKRCVH